VHGRQGRLDVGRNGLGVHRVFNGSDAVFGSLTGACYHSPTGISLPKALKSKARTVENGPQSNGVLERTTRQEANASDGCLRGDKKS